MFDLRNNLFTFCANHVANETLFFSTSHFPFFSLFPSLFLYSFILAFTESVRQNKQTKKYAVKQHKKITDFTFSYQPPLMSFFQSSSLFPQCCFVFAFFVFFLRKKTIKRITVLEKKRNFSVEWLRWRRVKVMVGNYVGSSNQEKNRCLWELQKPICALWWFWSVKSYASLYFC